MLLEEKERRLGKADLFYFNKEILGFSDFVERVHAPLCQFATAPGKRKKLILMPRGSFKSSAITIGQCLWEIVRDPNIRILIDSEKHNNSAKFLAAIKGVIETNEKFRALYGALDAKKDTMPWSQYEATVAARNKMQLKEPTLSTAGVDVVKVGMHYDLIILDDPVSENNVTTPEQIEKVINHYKFLLSILEPTGRLIIIGTRWDYSDLYGYILEEESDTFDIYLRKAVWQDEETGETKYLFPERLTPLFLDEMKRSQGSYIFNSQYNNEPVDREDAIFRSKWLKYHDGFVQNGLLHLGEKLLPVNTFTMIDPAISKKETADYSAIVTVCVDQHNQLYVLDYVNERLSPYELDDQIFNTYLKYLPVAVGIEAHANQSYFLHTLPEAQKRRRIHFRIVELKPVGDKDSRIRRLQPMFERGDIYLRKEHQVLVDQLLRFPFSRHDDVLDALAYATELCFPKRVLDGAKRMHKPLSSITGY